MVPMNAVANVMESVMHWLLPNVALPMAAADWYPPSVSSYSRMVLSALTQATLQALVRAVLELTSMLTCARSAFPPPSKYANVNDCAVPGELAPALGVTDTA